MKLIDTKGTVRHCEHEQDLNGLGFLIDILDSYGMPVSKWDTLSSVVKTMTGDSSTAFNTLREMIQHIPSALDCEEETNVICVFHNDGFTYHTIKWEDEDNVEVLNDILKCYLNYQLVE